jgi:hypothetical protein
MFHLIGALPRYGKVGALCVANSPARASRMYRTTVDTLMREAGALNRGSSGARVPDVSRSRTQNAR